MPVKKAKKATQSTRPKKFARAMNAAVALWATSPQAIALGVICALIAVAAMIVRQPTPSTPPTDVGSVATSTIPAPRDTENAAVSMPPSAELPQKARPIEPTLNTDVQNSASVTITGCLERDQEVFWLKDTSGAAAPKSRS